MIFLDPLLPLGCSLPPLLHPWDFPSRLGLWLAPLGSLLPLTIGVIHCSGWNLWHNWGVLDYHRRKFMNSILDTSVAALGPSPRDITNLPIPDSISFVPASAQARWLVEHHLPSVGWGALYQEAFLKAWYADHGTSSERWFKAIVSELELRGKHLLSFFDFLLCLSIFAFPSSPFLLRLSRPALPFMALGLHPSHLLFSHAASSFPHLVFPHLVSLSTILHLFSLFPFPRRHAASHSSSFSHSLFLFLPLPTLFYPLPSIHCRSAHCSLSIKTLAHNHGTVVGAAMAGALAGTP